MTIWIDRNGPRHDIEREIEKTEALLADLKRFAKRQLPTSREIEAAPLIDDYKIDIMARPVFIGHLQAESPLNTLSRFLELFPIMHYITCINIDKIPTFAYFNMHYEYQCSNLPQQ